MTVTHLKFRDLLSEYKNKIFLILGYILSITFLLLQIKYIISSYNNYPFNLAWSEGGRIFAAYQVYAPIIAGKYLSFPWLDPGRSILDGLVLLIPHVSIGTYRLWINILFFIFSFLAALLTVRKALGFSEIPVLQKKELVVLLSLWGTLFLLQGPIYYHLLAGILPILWFYDEKCPVRNLIVIIICSIWEALGRVNWFLMPATLVILLHVLRTPLPLRPQKVWNYIKWPLVYAFSGGISSFTIYLIYMKAMGFVIPFLNPSMNYHFALYKLWPNTGFMGLLPDITLISLPTLLIILYNVWEYRQKLHWIRLLIILSILGVFFAGSTVVSLRAGGGYDSHNYDSFLLLIFITICFLGVGAEYLDKSGGSGKLPLTYPAVIIFLLFIPIWLAIPKTSKSASSTTAPSEQSLSTAQSEQTFATPQSEQQALLEIKQILEKPSESNADHPILFIDQRQLLVFNMIKVENIVVPYEKIELMEMAMARNEKYKRQVQSDLENHKYSLIVSEVLVPWAKSYSPNLFERDWYENNVWVDFVAIPVLDNYSPIYINEDIGIAIYAPKQ